MKIHITGASGAGSTTLGLELAKRLSVPYFDTDGYYWEPSDPPFTIRRNRDLRNKMLENDLKQYRSWVLGGSVISWDDLFLKLFDLTIFLYVQPEIRMQRLKERELMRYGDIIYTDPQRNILYTGFMDWAASYEDNTTSSRSLKSHEAWLQKLTCPVFEIKGDTTIEERLALIFEKIENLPEPLI
jgi:adenylate kinase family enzyme